MKSKRKFTASLKIRVAPKAIRERESLSALSSKYKLSSKWKHVIHEKSGLAFMLESPEQKVKKEIRTLLDIRGYLQES